MGNLLSVLIYIYIYDYKKKKHYAQLKAHSFNVENPMLFTSSINLNGNFEGNSNLIETIVEVIKDENNVENNQSEKSSSFIEIFFENRVIFTLKPLQPTMFAFADIIDS